MMSSQLSGPSAGSAPSSLHSALQMNPPAHMTVKQPSPSHDAMPAPSSTGTKRRRKNNDDGDQSGPSEPRRLRRSHEACARCRGKKIKCDSKHPRCTACQTAGVECHQEDRHRQTLTPRGYTERVELQLAQCEALLKRHLPGFEMVNIEEFLARDGIEVTDNGSSFSGYQSAPPKAPANPYMYPPPGMMPPPPGYPSHAFPYPPGPPYQMPPMPAPAYNPHIHPAFQQQPSSGNGASYSPPPDEAQRALAGPDIKGQDPKLNDMSNTQALARTFGVSTLIVGDLKLTPAPVDKEDLAVGSNGLSSGRDRDVAETQVPRNSQHWRRVTVRRNSNADHQLSLAARPDPALIEVWLPKDRTLVQHIVDVYFLRLNIHRPVFYKKGFQKSLDDLYQDRMAIHDPGYICSLYLILALGTLSEVSHHSSELGASDDVQMSPPSKVPSKSAMPPEWPDHDEFFKRALGVKPDLKVTISSLQALILLHWYLYTERQGRTLWRLVGSLVRLSIELGLHHDPTSQLNPTNEKNLFSEEECQLRIRLWGIVLIHDRGTSLQLGRPLAIAPSDANTPRPSRMSSNRVKDSREDFSEHFDLSHSVAEIQADIINSLYSPSRQNSDTIMRNASRIIKSMVEFRRGLPEKYKYYFGGTDEWTLERKSKLVQEITEDEGLTLLKIGISRILLLRALFSSKELPIPHRRKALVDATIASHNTIIVHSQLIRFPDIAFFTSPIPLHIAAMVILYAHMSKLDTLPRHTALEDVWLALDMLPRFRWRWERKDVNGGHPLISKLAERVMKVNLHTVGPATNPVLLSEQDWEDPPKSPEQHPKSQHTTPTLSAAPYGSYGNQQRGMNGTNGHGTTPPGKHAPMPDCGYMFYPFFPEAHVNGHNDEVANTENGHYAELLAAAAAVPSSQDTYMSEDRDPQDPHRQHPHPHQHPHPQHHQQPHQQWLPPPPPPPGMTIVRYN